MIEEKILKDDKVETIKVFTNTESNTNILYKYNKENNRTRVFDNDFNLILPGCKVAIRVLAWYDVVTIESINKKFISVSDKYSTSANIDYIDITSIDVLNVENCK